MHLTLPVHACDLVPLGFGQRVLYGGIIGAHRALGAWKRPAPRSGDLATMTPLDTAYWLHKSTRPIDLPELGDEIEGLEAHRPRELPLPERFTVEGAVILAAVGDLMAHAFLGSSKGILYEDVAPRLFSADLSVANLEAVVLADRGERATGGPKLAPKLEFDPHSLDAVTNHRDATFSFVSLANNHVLDHGASAALATCRALDDRGIVHHGVNADRDAALRPALVEARGIRVAVVAWTFGLNARRPPPDAPWLVNHLPLNDPRALEPAPTLRAQLTAAQREADLVIASLHWGMEFERWPRRQQQQTARQLAELGADVILGHHPHVVQPVELYRTHRDPARVVPIFYSLGNLTNPCSAPFMCESLIARIRVVQGRDERGSKRTYVAGLDPQWVRQRADLGRRWLSLHPIASEEVGCLS